jgi:hypothetical protein
LSDALTKAKYPYLLSVAGLVLIALVGLYGLIVAFFIRRFLIRPSVFYPAFARTARPAHMFVARLGFPAMAFVLPSFVAVVGFVMIFLGLVWLGLLVFRGSASSKEPSKS